MAKYNLRVTLQTRDKNGKPVIYSPADNPHSLSDALGREAVARGLASEVAEPAKAGRRSSPAPAAEPVEQEEPAPGDEPDDDPDA